uniref:Glycosyl transferase CAP10 domain-containing protein n=1 Tax=Aureoumbra lagunensis TaxID=44058 RepID=A0A7S3JW75_9STRA
MPPTNNMLKAYAQLDKNPWIFTDAYVSHESFVKYQFLLNMPGQAGGSYSRNLNYLWSLGSIVFIWDAHYTEWYYPALRHGLTHLVVDESNAAKTVRMLKANASLASDLRWHARRIYDTFIAPHALADYMRFVLGAFRNKFPKLTETLNDKAKVNAILKRYKCGTSQFPLAEITRGSGHGKTHKLKLQPIPQDDPDLSACASSVEVIKKLSSRRRLNQEKSQVRHHPELSYHAPFCYVTPHEDNGDKEKKRKRRHRRAFLL